MRVNLKVEGASILSETPGVLSLGILLWCLEEFPLATLVVGDVSLNVLLDFTCSDRFFNLENIKFGFLLLLVLSV